MFNMWMSGSSVTSLDDRRKAPFTESTCEGVLDNIDAQSSVGISSVLDRARLEVSFNGLNTRSELFVGYPSNLVYHGTAELKYQRCCIVNCLARMRNINWYQQCICIFNIKVQGLRN